MLRLVTFKIFYGVMQMWQWSTTFC